MLTPQTLFNRAYRGILKQGKPATSFSAGGDPYSCEYYQNDTGNRCAVGHMVPIKTAKHMEDCDLGSIDNMADVGIKLLREHGIDVEEHRDFLSEIQRAHDDAPQKGFRNVFIKSMKAIAKEYNLKVPQ